MNIYLKMIIEVGGNRNMAMKVVNFKTEKVVDTNPNIYLERAEENLKNGRYHEALEEASLAIKYSNHDQSIVNQYNRIKNAVSVTFDCATKTTKNYETKIEYRTFIYTNGDKYEGQLKDGKRDGIGTYIFANGCKYVGDWKNDIKDGVGSIFYINGDIYSGQWRKDKREGQGTYVFANGHKYLGQWKDDKYLDISTY